ncbi:MAG: hypothetical protein QXQ94_10580 [Candidatus Bathyarchaeia archaeon]
MQIQCIKKKINLELLAKFTETFFKEKGFKTKLEQTKKSFTISCITHHEGKPRIMTVKIMGKPDDFIIELTNPTPRNLQLLQSVLTLFGWGFLILNELKSQEFYKKIEEEFLTFIDKTIENLANSATIN